MSHSRGWPGGGTTRPWHAGGKRAVHADEIALFDEPARRRDHNAPSGTQPDTAGSRFRVTRFVRVACPVRGTTLADRRLDRYFSILVNLVGWIPGLKGIRSMTA